MRAWRIVGPAVARRVAARDVCLHGRPPCKSDADPLATSFIIARFSLPAVAVNSRLAPRQFSSIANAWIPRPRQSKAARRFPRHQLFSIRRRSCCCGRKRAGVRQVHVTATALSTSLSTSRCCTVLSVKVTLFGQPPRQEIPEECLAHTSVHLRCNLEASSERVHRHQHVARALQEGTARAGCARKASWCRPEPCKCRRAVSGKRLRRHHQPSMLQRRTSL